MIIYDYHSAKTASYYYYIQFFLNYGYQLNNYKGDGMDKEMEQWKDEKIRELEEEYKDDERCSKNTLLTEREIEYILGLIKRDDDYAVDVCLNNSYYDDNLKTEEEMENDVIFNTFKKFYTNWQNNLKSKLERR